MSLSRGALEVEVAGLRLVYTPDAGTDTQAGVPPGQSGNAVSFDVAVFTLPADASLTAVFDEDLASVLAQTGSRFVLPPGSDVAFIVRVEASGFSGQDLGDNSVTMRVNSEWVRQIIAAGGTVTITKIEPDGSAFSASASCIEQGQTAVCTALFRGPAGGFSSFILHSITLGPVANTGAVAVAPSPTNTPLPAGQPTPALSPTRTQPGPGDVAGPTRRKSYVVVFVIAAAGLSALGAGTFIFLRRSPQGLSVVLVAAATTVALIASRDTPPLRADGPPPQAQVDLHAPPSLLGGKGDWRYARVDSAVRQKHQLFLEGGLRPEAATPWADPTMDVTVSFAGDARASLEAIEDIGGQVLGVLGGDAEVRVPVRSAPRLAFLDGAIRVGEIVPPQPLTITSEGAAAHGSPAWNALGFTGTGVKVGIIDLGFAGYSALIGTEVPSPVAVLCFPVSGAATANIADCEAGGVVHGTAVTEAVVDVAPGVQVYLSQPRTAVQLHSAVDWMIANGVQVINHSAGWSWDGPGDGTSPFSTAPLKAVDKAAAAGILWINSAGNSALDGWYGPYSDPDADGWVTISVADGETQSFTGTGSGTFELRWADSWAAAQTDLDFYLLDSTGHIVAKSDTEQSGVPGQIPRERISVDILPGDFLAVYRYSGPLPAWVQLRTFTGPRISAPTADHSIGNPADSANPGMLTVGAAHYSTTSSIESFSSQGPTTDGRVKPDLVGADRGNSASYGFDGFWGTSQASPHVVGLAALVKQRFPAFTPSEIAAYLKTSSLPRLTVPNNTWGYGFAHLEAHLAPVASNDSYSVNEDQTLTVAATGVLVNDTDDEDPITAALVGASSHGTLALNSNGSFTYTPAADFNGPDSFTYRAVDAFSTSATATVNITVQPVADVKGGASAQGAASSAAVGLAVSLIPGAGSPVALPLDGSGNFKKNADAGSSEVRAAAPGYVTKSKASLTVATSDLDIGPAQLRAGDVNGDGAVSSADVQAIFTAMAAGWTSGGSGPATRADASGNIVDLNGDGVLNALDVSLWAANFGLSGPQEWGAPPTTPPLALNDGYWVFKDAVLALDAPGVLGNDLDGEGDALTAVLVSGPSHGVLTLNPNGSLTYTPAGGFAGTDSFTYEARDGTTKSFPATVTIEVRELPATPTPTPTGTPAPGTLP